MKRDMLLKMRIEIKELIFQNDIRLSIDKLKKNLVKHSKSFDDLILIAARFKRIDECSHQSLISFQETEIFISKIANDIIHIVNNLNEEEIQVY